MAISSHRQPSALVSTGLQVATVALNVAGAAADAVPIAKQILNSAAHISAAAERIQKKHEAMYLLVEKADIYATQIDIAVAGRLLDTALERRLKRLYSIFLKIEALVDTKTGGKNALSRVVQNFITKPKRADDLLVELDRELQLFELLTGIQLSLAVDGTARALAEDARYDGQFRRLRGCDVEKLDVIRMRTSAEGVIVWSSARVDDQLMVIRCLESANHNDSTVTERSTSKWIPDSPALPAYHEFLQNIEQVSTAKGSHRFVAKLYGHRIPGPDGHFSAFRSGTRELYDHLEFMRDRYDDKSRTFRSLTLLFQMLDASWHLENVHALAWMGNLATVDDQGEPRIGSFDDIVKSDREVAQRGHRGQAYHNILLMMEYHQDELLGKVDRNVDLSRVMEEQLRRENGSDCLQRVWDTIRSEKLLVVQSEFNFPIIYEKLAVSQEMIERGRRHWTAAGNLAVDTFLRCILTRGTCTSAKIHIRFLCVNGHYQICLESIAPSNFGHLKLLVIKIMLPLVGSLVQQVSRAIGISNDAIEGVSGTYSSDIYLWEERGELIEECYRVENGSRGVVNDEHDEVHARGAEVTPKDE